MTPAQLSAIAAVHAVVNGDGGQTELEHDTQQQQGTVGDLMAFASMRTR